MIPNLIFILRRRWPILLLLPIVVVVGTVVLTPKSKPQPTRYTTKVYVAANPSHLGAVALQQAAVEVRQTKVAEAAAKRLGTTITDPKAFVSQLAVKVDLGSLSLQLSAVDTRKTYVKDYTTAFAEAFVQVTDQDANATYFAGLAALTDTSKKADSDVATYIDQHRAQITAGDPVATATQDTLQQQANDARIQLLTYEQTKPTPDFHIAGSDGVSTVTQAKLQLPDSVLLRGILAWMLGMLGAIAVTGFIEKLNPRIDNPKQAEAIVGAPVLAMVPVMRGKRSKLIHRADLDQFSGPFAEAFRAMRSHLDFRSTAEEMDRPPCVMVVSSAPAEGKTTTAAFLGLTYAEVGRDVVVVGADFRRPAIHRLFGVPRTPGLSSRLLGDDPSQAPESVVNAIVKRDERTGVRVIPSGPGTDRVTGLLGDLAVVTKAGLQSGCTVLIDTAPVMVANDAIDFLPLVDWVVVVVRLGKSTERTVRQTIQNLELNDAAIAGVVLVGSLESSDAKRYYYSYYRSEGESRSTTEQHLRAARERRQADLAKSRQEAPDEPVEGEPEAATVRTPTDGSAR